MALSGPASSATIAAAVATSEEVAALQAQLQDATAAVAAARAEAARGAREGVAAKARLEAQVGGCFFSAFAFPSLFLPFPFFSAAGPIQQAWLKVHVGAGSPFFSFSSLSRAARVATYSNICKYLLHTFFVKVHGLDRQLQVEFSGVGVMVCALCQGRLAVDGWCY